MPNPNAMGVVYMYLDVLTSRNGHQNSLQQVPGTGARFDLGEQKLEGYLGRGRKNLWAKEVTRGRTDLAMDGIGLLPGQPRSKKKKKKLKGSRGSGRTF